MPIIVGTAIVTLTGFYLLCHETGRREPITVQASASLSPIMKRTD